MPPSSVAFFIPRPAIQPQQALEELAVLVEMVDGIVVVGARTIHELVEVVGQSLLGLPRCAISCGDQRGVVRPAPILPVLFAPLSRGAFVWILVRCAPFFPWPVSLPQQAPKKLAVLVEMVDGIVVVGA